MNQTLIISFASGPANSHSVQHIFEYREAHKQSKSSKRGFQPRAFPAFAPSLPRLKYHLPFYLEGSQSGVCCDADLFCKPKGHSPPPTPLVSRTAWACRPVFFWSPPSGVLPTVDNAISVWTGWGWVLLGFFYHCLIAQHNYCRSLFDKYFLFTYLLSRRHQVRPYVT